MSKKHIINPRRGLPGGHSPTKHPPLDEDQLNYAIGLLGVEARTNEVSVKKNISFIVAVHREFYDQDMKPSRSSHMKLNLDCVLEAAKELRSHISNLDYLTLRALHEHGAFQHQSLSASFVEDQISDGASIWAKCFRVLFRAERKRAVLHLVMKLNGHEPIADDQRSEEIPTADDKNNSDEFKAICERGDSRLLSILDDIAQASGLASVGLKDSGGTIKNSFLDFSANGELVASCYRLFNEYRPGEAKTTAGGDFRTFVSAVVQLAIGKEVDLEGPVREFIKKNKLKLKKQ